MQRFSTVESFILPLCDCHLLFSLFTVKSKFDTIQRSRAVCCVCTTQGLKAMVEKVWRWARLEESKEINRVKQKKEGIWVLVNGYHSNTTGCLDRSFKERWHFYCHSRRRQEGKRHKICLRWQLFFFPLAADIWITMIIKKTFQYQTPNHQMLFSSGTIYSQL